MIKDESDEELKVPAISFMGRFSTGNADAVKLLKCLLNDSPLDAIRGESAWALGSVATSDKEVYQTLRSLLLDSGESAEVRRNAAFALAEVITEDSNLVYAVLRLANRELPKKLRMAAIHALRKCIQPYPHVREAFLDWANGEGTEARVACQILARGLAEGEIAWDRSLSLHVEVVLRRIGSEDGLGEPCSHVLSALTTLVESRESRGGISLQETLQNAFGSIQDRLKFCFIFGSTARNQQSADSDIDVMMIGDVTMDVVSPLLKKAEEILGRQINPTIYSVSRFRDRLQDGNHFIATVLRERKLPSRSRTF